MKIIERFHFVFVVAGLGFFALSVVVMAVLPWLNLKKIPMRSVEELAKDIPAEFCDLAERYPEQFKKYFGDVDSKQYAKALRLGRDTYVAEACWHCHSQYVRPVANEDIRFGEISIPDEYQNELQLPQLFGTRRVGPDLTREGGKHSNDWHTAHFYNPRNVVPTSIMPKYPWFFDAPGKPNERGLAIIAYVQWLGKSREGLKTPEKMIYPGCPACGIFGGEKYKEVHLNDKEKK
ncbi:cbb3-type cytochrome c oxidase subunit II [Candidatus Peregrinibacteria bacterium]|nr:cbb3-type cytochrome c oxidase subunit II [Candidatus Peregrinibacteria bacterium]